MKILFVNKFLHPNGGSETYIFELGKQLTKMGHEVQYFGMEHEKRCVGNRIDCYTRNMDFHTGKLQKLLYPFKIIYSVEAKKKMAMVLEDFGPDVVHINNINFQLTPSIIDAVKKYEKNKDKKIRLIATAHDYQWVCPNHMLMIPSSKQLCFACEGGKYRNCMKNKCIHNSAVKSILGSIEAYFYKIRKIYKEIDVTICPSEFLNQKLSTNIEFRNKTITMHNFIVLHEKENGQRNTDILQKCGIPVKYVIYFGRFSEEKGIRKLLEVCKELTQIPFVFAGSGPLEDEVNQVNNIINVGFQTGDSLQKLIQEAQFCVFPSEWYENCPFSVMETQAHGTPILASDLGGTPELVENKITGELFEGGNKESLRNKVLSLWEAKDVLATYQKNCRKKKVDTVEEYCNKLLGIYKEVEK